MLTRDLRAAAVVTAGAAIAIVGTFLPWVRSGSRDRSSFQIFGLVDRLGFAPDGPVSWTLHWWAFAPLLVVLTVVAAWLRPGSTLVRRAVLTSGLVVPVVLGGTALALRRAPQSGLLTIGVGPSVTAIGCATIAVGMAWSGWQGRR